MHNKFDALSEFRKDCENKFDAKMEVLVDLIKPKSKQQSIIKAAKTEHACVKNSAEIAVKTGPGRDLLTQTTIKNRAEYCPILSGKANGEGI